MDSRVTKKTSTVINHIFTNSVTITKFKTVIWIFWIIFQYSLPPTTIFKQKKQRNTSYLALTFLVFPRKKLKYICNGPFVNVTDRPFVHCYVLSICCTFSNPSFSFFELKFDIQYSFNTFVIIILKELFLSTLKLLKN